MAITYQQIIRDALVGANVIAENQSPSAVQANDGARLLNELLLDWEDNDEVELGFFPQEDLTANVAIPQRAERAVKLALTVAFYTEYNLEPEAGTVALASNAYSRLVNRSMADIPDVDMSALPQGQAKGWG